MKWIVSESFDVFYNLALEEYLCRTVNDDDCFILWTNDDSVVIGRNQNIFEEVNVDDAAADGISLARRNPGGGAVFHDKGNINFSIISTFDENALNSYDEFLDPVIDMLHSLHVPATKRNKSDKYESQREQAQYNERDNPEHGICRERILREIYP